MDTFDVPAGWTAQGYEDGGDGMCALLASVQLLDEAVSQLPVSEPAAVLQLVARCRSALDFIELAARS